MIVTAPLLFVGFLKGISIAASQAPDPMQRSVFGALARAVSWLYQMAASVLPSMTEFLWLWAPQLNLAAPSALGVASPGFVAAYVLFLLGGYLRGVAYRIDVRLTQTLRRVEEMAWEEALRNELRKGTSVDEATRKLNVTISIVGQEPPWYQRGWGVVLLGVALPLIVKVLEIAFGLSKLP